MARVKRSVASRKRRTQGARRSAAATSALKHSSYTVAQRGRSSTRSSTPTATASAQKRDIAPALDHAHQRRRARAKGSRTTSSSPVAARPGSSSTARCSPASRSSDPAAFGKIAEHAEVRAWLRLGRVVRSSRTRRPRPRRRSQLYVDLLTAWADRSLSRRARRAGSGLGRARLRLIGGLHYLVPRRRGRAGTIRSPSTPSSCASSLRRRACRRTRCSARGCSSCCCSRVAAADGCGDVRSRRARPERRAQSRLGSLPLPLRGGGVGARGRGARLRGRGASCRSGRAARPGGEVRGRVGIDRSPIDVTTEDGARLLRSFVWAGQEGRMERLDRAIEATSRTIRRSS